MSSTPTRPTHPLSYQEALRCLGALLDAAVAPRARLAVSPDDIEVEAPGGFGYQRFTWDQLVELSEARMRLRGQVPISDRPLLTRWEGLLRLAGRAIDSAGVPRIELHAAVATLANPTRCYVEITVGGQILLGEDELVDQLQQVEAIRAARGEGRAPGE